MENMKKSSVPGMSRTLRDAAQDEAFIKAAELIKKHQKIRIINHLYPEDYE